MPVAPRDAQLGRGRDGRRGRLPAGGCPPPPPPPRPPRGRPPAPPPPGHPPRPPQAHPPHPPLGGPPTPPRARAAIARRLNRREFIHCDLHMHTDHSPDCATPVDVLLDTAKRRGLGAIAVTDHNEISGALEARERADGIKVIVSEE